MTARDPGVCECGELGFEITENADSCIRRRYICLECGHEWEEDWWSPGKIGGALSERVGDGKLGGISVAAAFYAYRYIHMRENKAAMEMEWVDVSENKVIATCAFVAYDREMDRHLWDHILRKLTEELGGEKCQE